ncbi:MULTISPECIES: alanine--glyoxylate aminotransferase family protein [Thermoactinomyces]|jgi:aspartate aminotransferase-like enzyme|uniref:Alanine--glyoxylate aminotransferase family protein n=1 Tax=Thermoactinomyces daqus TaxID=1329516 RepID=A0A7W1XAH7_9BACL|nr:MULTISPECIES: alanine--glyoxylate aminotransferase family protein [Thermoactinomyces]MBA4543107.1 alanine--glyoxylate aminotransferase family protein [Thermoactinomyces daqus]MBH8596658.1 alanine--glyoxylate aminotransferase family protein [Thermoactinomyces sp. CICC 10523]MBH8607813.1 alanine--glyoxylate aminotransferase family protein [Thermoactinomyces sp. CICC 10521]
MSFSDKFHLRIPGPTPVPARVMQAMQKPMIGHRSGEASSLYLECSAKLKLVFGTKTDPLLLSSSGTGALEAAVVNTVSPGEEAVVVVTGAFGDRFAKIVQKYGITLHRLDLPWGKACDPDLLASFLRQHPAAKAVFFTYCETSTGVLNPVRELAQSVREHSDALVIADGVSCLGAVPCKMDEWGIDIMVTGSQKALMLPPGLAFAAVSQRAWKQIEQNPTPRFYLDLLAYRKNLEKETTPYTPALSLLYGLAEALAMLEEEGLPRVFARHERLKTMTRAGIKALGLELMTSDADASPTVTSVYGGREKWEAETLRKELRALGVGVAGGQQHLKGKIFRIGHMGYCDELDILTVLSALEIALIKTGVPVELGSGVKAAQEVMLHV